MHATNDDDNFLGEIRDGWCRVEKRERDCEMYCKNRKCVFLSYWTYHGMQFNATYINFMLQSFSVTSSSILMLCFFCVSHLDGKKEACNKKVFHIYIFVKCISLSLFECNNSFMSQTMQFLVTFCCCWCFVFSLSSVVIVCNAFSTVVTVFLYININIFRWHCTKIFCKIFHYKFSFFWSPRVCCHF